MAKCVSRKLSSLQALGCALPGEPLPDHGAARVSKDVAELARLIALRSALRADATEWQRARALLSEGIPDPEWVHSFCEQSAGGDAERRWHKL